MARMELLTPTQPPFISGVLDVRQKMENVKAQRMKNMFAKLGLEIWPEERAWDREERARKREEWESSDISTGLQQDVLRGTLEDQEVGRGLKALDEIDDALKNSSTLVGFNKRRKAIEKIYGEDALDVFDAFDFKNEKDYKQSRDAATGLTKALRIITEETAGRKVLEETRGEQRRLTDEAEFDRIIGAGGIPYGMKVPETEKPTGLDWEALTPTAAQKYAIEAEKWFNEEYVPKRERGSAMFPWNWGEEEWIAPTGRAKQIVKASYLWDMHGVRNAWGVTDEEIAEVAGREGERQRGGGSPELSDEEKAWIAQAREAMERDPDSMEAWMRSLAPEQRQYVERLLGGS